MEATVTNSSPFGLQSVIGSGRVLLSKVLPDLNSEEEITIDLSYNKNGLHSKQGQVILRGRLLDPSHPSAQIYSQSRLNKTNLRLHDKTLLSPIDRMKSSDRSSEAKQLYRDSKLMTKSPSNGDSPFLFRIHRVEIDSLDYRRHKIGRHHYFYLRFTCGEWKKQTFNIAVNNRYLEFKDLGLEAKYSSLASYGSTLVIDLWYKHDMGEIHVATSSYNLKEVENLKKVYEIKLPLRNKGKRVMGNMTINAVSYRIGEQSYPASTIRLNDSFQKGLVTIKSIAVLNLNKIQRLGRHVRNSPVKSRNYVDDDFNRENFLGYQVHSTNRIICNFVLLFLLYSFHSLL